MTFSTKLYTLFNGHMVGEDQYGNKYFRTRKQKKGEKQKRWVMYNGAAEPSKVPPEWHGWLHHTFERPPTERTLANHKWQKDAKPNLTGTPGAYAPPGHLASKEERFKSTADYDAWTPQ